MHQELASAGRIRREMRRDRGQRAYVRAEEVELRTAHHDIALGDLRTAGANRLHFPAFEGDAGLVALLDEIIVGRLAVLDDGHEEF